MFNAWKRECNVEMRSICLEAAAVVFIKQWEVRLQRTLSYHDWMVRDFFAFLLRYQSTGSWAKPAGIDELIPLGDKWQSKALTAYTNAVKASELENPDEIVEAPSRWAKIFGNQFEASWMSSMRALLPKRA